MLLLFFSLRNTTIQFATVWIFATILPYVFGSNTFYFSRYWYLPSVGGAFMLSFLFERCYRQLTMASLYRSILLTVVIIITTLFSLKKLHHYEGRFLADAANFYLTHRNDARTSISLYDRANKKYRIQHPILFHHQAIAYGKVQEYEKAHEAILKAIQRNPDSPNSYLVLSIIAYEKKEFEVAIDASLYASQMDGQFIPELHKLADRLKSDQHYNQALLAYQKTIEYYPNYPDAFECYLSISEIFYLKNRYHESVSILQDLLQIQPQHSEAQKLLAKIQIQQTTP